MTSSICTAHWRNSLPPQPFGDKLRLHDWLTDRVSLTRKLMASSNVFEVRRLRQDSDMPFKDEWRKLDLAKRQKVQIREVALVCDGHPAVFAHTIVALGRGASDWPFFNSLNNRSLGSALFADPQVKRGALQFAMLPMRHPLWLRAQAVCRTAMGTASLPARRSLFRRGQGSMLVTEVFLPAIAALDGAAWRSNCAS